MARIDRLQEEARRVLQMASVIGRIFPYRVLAAIAAEEAELAAHLLTLQREEMVRERARVPELEYIFKHHLTQEAAYSGLLRRERRRFHRQVAEAVEGLYPDRVEEQLGLLAHHWEQAGERGKAIDYLRRAGEQAASQFANAEAVGYFGRALELTPEEDLAGRYQILLARERVRDLQGIREAQVQDLSDLEALADTLQDDGKRAEVALRQAWHANYTADYLGGITAAQRAVSLAHTVGDVRTEARANVQWARALEYHGDYSGAENRLEQALTLSRAAHLRRVEAECLYRIGRVSRAQGDLASTRARYEESLRIYCEIGHRWGESTMRSYLAGVSLSEGRYDEATTYLKQAVREFREIGDRWYEGLAHALFGGMYHALGYYDMAMDHYNRYLQSCRRVGDRRGEVYALTQLGLLCHHLGDDQIAREDAQQALQMARDQENPAQQGTALTYLGHALVGLARLDEASDVYGEALVLLRKLELPHLALETLTGLARVCLTQGNLAGSQGHVEDILHHLKTGSLDGTLEPARIYLTCYRVLKASDDGRAEHILEEAYRFLQERAAKISDEEERRSFLENVEEHSEIVCEWAHNQV